MTKFILCAVACLIALGSGCSSIKVSNDYDQDADFRTYETYDWLDNRPNIPAEVVAAMNQNPLFDKRLRSAAESELNAKGLTRDQTDPDILLTYHVGVEDKVDVTDWGYRYSGQYYGYQRDIQLYQYHEGTLIIDMIDAKTMQLVWRASGTKTVDENPAPEQLDKRINDAVGRILASYPPAQ